MAPSAAHHGPPSARPTTDHMSQTAGLDGKMSTATVRRATTQDADVLGIIGPAAYAEAYGYLWDRPDAYFDQLRTFGAPASRRCSPNRTHAYGSARWKGPQSVFYP